MNIIKVPQMKRNLNNKCGKCNRIVVFFFCFRSGKKDPISARKPKLVDSVNVTCV